MGRDAARRFKADGSGRDGLLAVTKDGSLYSYATGPNGVLLDQRREMWHDKTWNKKLVTTGDFNGDGRDDIAAIANNGAMHLYLGNAEGRFDSGTSMWRDNTWDSYQAVLGGDFNRDGKSDIAALNGAGELYLYPIKGDGTLDERSPMRASAS
ncbi:VCBS repeat-containing protein [Streptomyces sp. NPDC026206]|uniref:FG-GAP repeat domain-containing protein n=1 Tax=Streptomyces sp. NPDC026206 TaxID=3157089 RepID=UPI0033D5DFD9